MRTLTIGLLCVALMIIVLAVAPSASALREGEAPVCPAFSLDGRVLSEEGVTADGAKRCLYEAIVVPECPNLESVGYALGSGVIRDNGTLRCAYVELEN